MVLKTEMVISVVMRVVPTPDPDELVGRAGVKLPEEFVKIGRGRPLDGKLL